MSTADIRLYTAPTMNGWKPLIFLEEAGVDYELVRIDFSRDEQHAAWYLELNPNGRIPTLVDRANDDFAVFESGAILWYLAEKYGCFLPADARARSRTLQWLMFQMGGIGPMMGQAMYFRRIAEPQGYREEFSIRRFSRESRRLLEVLDRQLARHAHVAGDDYTIADMAVYPWARSWFWAGVSVEDLSNLRGWLDRLDQRPAIRRALQLPEPFPEAFGEGDVEAAVRTNADRFRID